MKINEINLIKAEALKAGIEVESIKSTPIRFDDGGKAQWIDTIAFIKSPYVGQDCTVVEFKSMLVKEILAQLLCTTL